MAFSINDLANELGIDVATLKPEAVSKWNGYLTQADSQYQTASREKKDALEALETAKREQAVIDEQIQKFGLTETTVAELRTANAAYAAAMEEVKKQGFSVNMPNLPTPKIPPAADPTQEWKQGFRQMGAAMRVQSKYQSIYGKPFADDPIALVDEAIANRMSVDDWAAKKYDFAGQEKKQADEAFRTKVQSEVDAQVKKYKEENPTTAGNPLAQRGVASRHPQIFKPRDAASDKTFRNLPVKERIAQSVARARAAISTSDVA